VALPLKIARPPRGNDVEDWKDWAEEVERVINMLLARAGSAYTPTNVTTDRTFDADATSVAELGDVVGTLIGDLQTFGLLR
jgi:hypothetical protein